MPAPSALRVALLALACMAAGCAGGGGGGNEGGGGGGPPSQGCTPPATTTVAFKDHVQPVFNRSCALVSCHIPGALGGDLDLTPGHSYKQIVNHPSFEQPARKRVKPGDPEGSYLVMKMEGATGISGAPMPLNCPTPPPGGQCPGPDDLPAIKQWIVECATNN